MNSVEFVQGQKKNNIFNILGIGKLGPRINRIEYLGLSLSWHVLAVCLAFFISCEYIDLYLGFALLLYPIIKSWALAIRRMHDFNRSGWWLLLCAIPYVGIIVFLALFLFFPGTKGSNRFGHQPSLTSKKRWAIFATPIIFIMFLLMLVFYKKFFLLF